jgi:hypothetical protein
MSMKISDIAKSNMLKTTGQMKHEKHEARADRFGKSSVILNRKEQRKLDQAAGLVPFACKLPSELVTALNAEAIAKKLGMNELVAGLLKKGLA